MPRLPCAASADTAVECGYERLAEVQEEILWLCQAAHVPVIWATQVLDRLAKTGRPSRAEITDAAMRGRAECVMLNTGPRIIEPISVLDDILRRMEQHHRKKRFAPAAAGGLRLRPHRPLSSHAGRAAPKRAARCRARLVRSVNLPVRLIQGGERWLVARYGEVQLGAQPTPAGEVRLPGTYAVGNVIHPKLTHPALGHQLERRSQRASTLCAFRAPS